MPPSWGRLSFTSRTALRTTEMFSSYLRPGLKPTCGSPMMKARAWFSFCAMHRANIRYSMVVTEMGLYFVGSCRSPLFLKMGESMAWRIVAVREPRFRSSLKSLLSSGAISCWCSI